MKPTSKESGKAEKPGKALAGGHGAGAQEASTGTNAQGTANGEAPPHGAETEIFTPASVASLLRSEFAEEEPTGATEDASAAEVQAGAAETESTEGVTAESAENAEATGEEQEQGQEREQEPEIPEALSQAITEWEEAGGGELPPALQGLVQKRIDKLTSQRETERQAREAAETRTQQLEAELAEARAQGGGASVPELPNEQGLARMEQAAQQVLSDIENYLDDTANDEERGRVERYMQSERLDEKGLKRRVREINGWLTQQLPQQRLRLTQFTQQEKAFEPEARKYFPWLWDKASPEYQEAQKVLQVMPDLVRRTPAHRFALGIYVLGLKAFEQEKAAAAKGTNATNGAKPATKLPVKVPPKAPTAGAAAPAARAVGKQAQEAAARARFEKAPTRENVEALLKQGLT